MKNLENVKALNEVELTQVNGGYDKTEGAVGGAAAGAGIGMFIGSIGGPVGAFRRCSNRNRNGNNISARFHNRRNGYSRKSSSPIFPAHPPWKNSSCNRFYHCCFCGFLLRNSQCGALCSCFRLCYRKSNGQRSLWL